VEVSFILDTAQGRSLVNSAGQALLFFSKTLYQYVTEQLALMAGSGGSCKLATNAVKATELRLAVQHAAVKVDKTLLKQLHK